jgi:tRNA(Ile)-lysidine synthase TilS/MesJ
MTGFLKPPKSLLRKVGKAIADFGMIRDGDRLLLGVSGGKDSLTLLHILGHLQTYAPVKFDLGVITVDPEVEGFDPHTLTRYYDEIGVKWHYQEQPIMEQAKEHMDGDSFCSYCSRMKRGIMYSTCRREGYNVLALAQHLDDLAESLLMSIFYGGQLRTMKAHYTNRDGDIRIIRPLVYVRETMTAAFAKEAKLPVIPDSCPACFSMPTRREQTKLLLRQLEKENKNLFANMLHAMQPLLTEEFE